MNKIFIGYWYKESDPQTHGFPKPVENSASHEDIKKMNFVMKNKIFAEGNTQFYKGTSVCRLCGCTVGNGETIFTIRNKGKVVKAYIVPTGIIHYINQHRVLIPMLIELYERFDNEFRSKK